MYMATYMATGRTGNARTNEPQFTQTSSAFAMTCGAMFALTRSMLPDFRPIFETYANDLKREAERIACAHEAEGLIVGRDA